MAYDPSEPRDEQGRWTATGLGIKAQEASEKAKRSNSAADHRAAATLHRQAAKERLAQGSPEDREAARQHQRIGRNHDSMAVRAAKKENGPKQEPTPVPKEPEPTTPKAEPNPVKSLPVTGKLASPKELSDLRSGVTEKISYNAQTEQTAKDTMARLTTKYPQVVKVIGKRAVNKITFALPTDAAISATMQKLSKGDSVLAWYSTSSAQVFILEKISHIQKIGQYGQSKLHNVGLDSLSSGDRTTATLIHELGHHVDYNMIDAGKNRSTVLQKLKAEAWANAQRTKCHVSKYAETNEREYFAETWTAYHVSPKQLRAADPVGHDMIDKVVKRFS